MDPAKVAPAPHIHRNRSTNSEDTAMSAQRHLRACLLLWILILSPLQGFAQTKPDASAADHQGTLTERDGQRDFDFEIGTWKTHLRRLLHPLTGSTTWAEYDGTSIVRKIWNGGANLVELKVDGPAGSIEALSLRLYN